MATALVLLFSIFICNTIFAELYQIVSLNDINQTNLEKNICYMTNIDNKNTHWCESVASEFVLPTIKTCVSINESFPCFDDLVTINEWIDRSIATTNCSYFLLSSITISQKRILIIVESILLFILFLPFIFQLSFTVIQYYFY